MKFEDKFRRSNPDRREENEVATPKGGEQIVFWRRHPLFFADEKFLKHEEIFGLEKKSEKKYSRVRINFFGRDGPPFFFRCGGVKKNSRARKIENAG